MTTDKLEVRAAAQRKMDKLPLAISDDDLDNCIKCFQAKTWPLPEELCPSGACLERKLGELE